MRTIVLALVAAIALAGCTASSAMRSYVGGTLEAPVRVSGPPTSFYNIDQNTRAFVWSHMRTDVSGGWSSTSGTATVYDYGSSAFVMGSSTTYSVPPQVYTYTCHHILYGRQNSPSAALPSDWIIVGYERPPLSCE